MPEKEELPSNKKPDTAPASQPAAPGPIKPLTIARSIRKDLPKTGKDTMALPQIAEISIWLDTYDDVFSDFDPRPYTQRTMSNDFINAAKNEIKETSGGRLEMILMIPEKLRVPSHEDTIRKRIRDYFKSNYEVLDSKTKSMKKWGYLIFAGGIIAIFISSLVHMIQAPVLVQNLLYSIFEPMGFFMLFTGLDQVMAQNKNKENIEFYKKIAEGNIKFIQY
jgi:hypothetical protein